MAPAMIRFTQPMVGTLSQPLNTLHTDGVEVQLNQLDCNEQQMSDIHALYTNQQVIKLLYRLEGDNTSQLPTQLEAKILLAKHYLGPNELERLESRWSRKWVIGWGEGDTKLTRVLYQCSCGYSSARRQAREAEKKKTTPSEVCSRHCPFEFTGCLAHVEITSRESDCQILRIMGVLSHNTACQESDLVRRPPIPLHPHVYDIAIEQLRNGADLQSVKAKNRHLIQQQFYNGMQDDPKFRNFRYLILRSDSTVLYRTISRLHGINTSQLPERNIHQWLDPDSPFYQRTLHKSVFYYVPRTSSEGRFKACIASEEMAEMAWRYGQGSQILLDGTFGVCDRRVLMFVAMAIDQDRKGVPLAVFLFSAPTGNKQTSAGYNTEILTELLSKWRAWLESQKPGVTFGPLVAITDTDTKERAALLAVFPGIVLLLCKFHLRQCWTNKRRLLLGPSQGEDFIKQQLKGRLNTLEIALIESTEHTAALDLVKAERQYLQAHLLPYHPTAPSAKAATKFLDYLEEYWLNFGLWASWSLYGRLRAAKAMDRAVEGVVPTTNHLESFNRLLKKDYIKKLEKGGKRLRFDVLFHHLIARIIPAIFNNRQHLQAHDNWVSSRFNNQQFESRPYSSKNPSDQSSNPIAWIPTGAGGSSRQKEGVDIAKLGRVFGLRYIDSETLEASCLSSRSLQNDPGAISYLQRLHLSGFGCCSCPDFRKRSAETGACKHLFALLSHLAQSRQQFPAIPIPSFSLPADKKQAIRLYNIYSSIVNFQLTESLPFESTITELHVPQLMGSPAEDTAPIGRTQSTHSADVGVGQSNDWDLIGSDVELELSGEEHIYATLLSSDSEGVQDQLRVQLNHLTRRILPPLYSLELLLHDLQVVQTPDIAELTTILGRLHTALDQRLARNSSSPSVHEGESRKRTSSDKDTEDPLVASTVHKRQRRSSSSDVFLRPPSPEARQIRKDSYGTF